MTARSVGSVLAATWLSLGVLGGGCGDGDEDEPRKDKTIDVARSGGPATPATPTTPSFCELAADHVLSLCTTTSCEGVSGAACRAQLVTACQQDLAQADGVFKYMCRKNAQDCAEAKACSL